jgi:uncharacterized membrane protein YfcA
MALAILALALVAGVLIGCVGIGGVLLVPSLSLGGVSVHAAIGASMLCYLFAGGVTTWIYAREGSIAWRSAIWLSSGAMPGAFGGAVLAQRASADLLLALIGVAVLFSGLRSLVGSLPSEGIASKGLAPRWLSTIGALVGLGSALTGTGGPVLLVPLLIWLRLPVLMVVGLSQAIQVPIALCATIGTLAYGHLDLVLGALLSVGVVGGSAAGARIAHKLPRPMLTRLVGLVLLGVGGLLIVRNRDLLVFF